MDWSIFKGTKTCISEESDRKRIVTISEFILSQSIQLKTNMCGVGDNTTAYQGT